ncbi:MAG: hypothetical protein AMXMBFR47_12070 [Planctomycetota bacterium]
MRIWLLTSEWNSGGLDDLSRWARGYAQALARAGHEVTVFGVDAEDRLGPSISGLWYVGLPAQPSGDGAAGADERTAVEPSILSHWPAMSYRLANLVLERAGRSGPPDVIEAQSMYGLPYFLLQRKLTQPTAISATPVVVNALGSYVGRLAANEASPYRLPDYWVGRMERFCLQAADSVLCHSAAIERELCREPEVELPIVRFAPTAWRPPDATMSGAGAGVNLECPAPLERRTGVLRLTEACAALWREGMQFRLHLTGADARCAVLDRPLSEVISARHGGWVDAGMLVHAAGSAPHPAWICVFPECGSDFGIACAEAIAGGRRVIAARGGDPGALLGEHAPVVFDPRDPGSLRAAITVACGAIRGTAGGLPVGDAIRERIALFEGLAERHTVRRSFPAIGVPARETVARARSAEKSVEGRLSIVVPHYNLGAYIDETIASIRAADWPDREIIVVDDGSTEPASVAAIDRIAGEAASDLKVIRSVNQGPAAARNAGAAAATGEFIALVDADDLVEPAFFPRCIDVLRRYDDVGFVYSWVRYFGAAEGLWPTWNAELPYLLGHNLLTVFIVMRRADYLRFGRQHSDFASDYEDYDGFISMVEAGLKGVALPDPLVRYRIRPESRHRSYHSDQSLHLYRLLTKHHAASYQKYGIELFNLQLVNGPSQFWSNPAAAPYDPQARIAELEKLHRAAWEEGQRLSAAWETQRQQIETQAARIAELDAAYAASRNEAGELARGWETQRAHIDEQRARIEELDAEIARMRSEGERQAAGFRAELERQSRLATDLEAEARRLADSWNQVSAHNAEQAARIAELDAALRAAHAEASRLSDAWATQKADIDRLSAKIEEMRSLRGWLRNRRRAPG